MSVTCTVRGLEPRDMPELIELCREHAEFERSAWSACERTVALRALLLDAPDARCWVVQAEERLAGFASASLELSTWDAARYLHLDCLYLRAAFRGRGLGRTLFERAAAAAVELGAVNLQWQTPDWNENAARFYRRLGATAQPKLRFTLAPEACRALRPA